MAILAREPEFPDRRMISRVRRQSNASWPLSSAWGDDSLYESSPRQGLPGSRFHGRRGDIQPQISPIRVPILDELQLGFAIPFLDLLLPHDVRFHGRMNFEPNQVMDTVTSSEAIQLVLAVLGTPLDQFRCHTDVQGAVKATREEIHTRKSFHVRSLTHPCELDSGNPCRNDGLFDRCASTGPGNGGRSPPRGRHQSHAYGFQSATWGIAQP